MKKLKIRIAEGADFSPEVVLKLEAYFTVDLAPCSAKDIPSILSSYDVFWFRLGFRISEKDIPANPRCKVIATPVTGIDHIDTAACEKASIGIISLKGEVDFLRTVRATAEHTILLTLMLLRHPLQAIRSVNEGIWNRDLFRGNEVYGKTVGIVGLGRLGEIVGSYFQAMGAVVIGFDKHDRVVPGVAQVRSLEEIAQRSDIISIHLSLDASTNKIINESFLGLVKKECILINTSRGGIVDEKALLFALENGLIKAAAVDVLQDEQAGVAGNPLVAYAKTHDNLVITPHLGGNTYESFRKTEHFIAGKIISFFGV